ncbi:MAG TPA: hypothetical protein VNX68_02835 [Nitrosopumilaceae archaeon]|jgi:hypothetical protein|nr:hypothetical protein [Nitrosopumilaceae archaeon]
MEKDVIIALKVDIENAEKFFDRTGNDIKEAYKCIDENVDKVGPDGKVSIFLYIPESGCDMYDVYLS